MRGDGLMQIADAMVSVNQRVNLIGVVVESSIPKRSKGTDFFCSVKIIDESRTSGGYVHFFTESMESLPQVENVGDVLVARNFKCGNRWLCWFFTHGILRTKTWKRGETYVEFNKEFSSFALFDGRDSSIPELVPYQISSRYEPRDRDKEFIMMLRKWSVQQNISVLHESLLLREIKEADQLNLLCKILYISNANSNEPMLFVWDGTDTPPAPLEANLEDEAENPLPLQIEPSVLSRDILCTFPAVGTVLRMSVDQGGQMLGLHYLKPNRWVKLTNVKCKVRASLWTTVLQPFSKICYLRDDEDVVIHRLRSHNVRVASKWRRMPFTSLPRPSRVTETRHPDLPFVTLMDVLIYPEVTYTFKCVVRVVAIYPWSAEDLCSPSGIYRVRLTLEDPTGRLHAYLYEEDGVNFFGDVQSVDVLTTKLNKLLGVNEGGVLLVENVTRNPPWIQCCLCSYYTDGSDVWGTRAYRFFDTTCLVGRS